MSIFKLANFRELFDKNNSISEDIVAMAVLITEGVVLTISCICGIEKSIFVKVSIVSAVPDGEVIALDDVLGI